MKPHFKIMIMALVALGWFSLESPAQAYIRQFWSLVSPDQGQTFAYGSESRRLWMVLGKDRHLALELDYTNDPYVDRSNPRQYDYFVFNFPSVKLGPDGRTFYYRAPNDRMVPVAEKRPVLFGTEIRLLPSSQLSIEKPHGKLKITIIVQDVKAGRQDGA